MHPSAIHGLSKYNWDGETVVFDPVVPSSRPVVGGKSEYSIDVREFLVTERNAVVRNALSRDLRAFMEQSDRKAWERFTGRDRGCFDFRAATIASWVGHTVKYTQKRGRDPWQFPDETLHTRAGDCEDRAFLLASLLLASGISGYHVRVALGHLRTSDGNTYDHAWVMYKNERGRWLLVEPLLGQGALPRKQSPSRRGAPSRRLPRDYRPHSVAAEYVPLFLFNADHLWAVGEGHDTSFKRVATKTWRKMNPKFAGHVHQTILHKALSDLVTPDAMAKLDARFSPAVLGVIGPTVDESDRGTYDPLDHFDNGLIRESWALVKKRLQRFRANQGDLTSFAQAAHGIADFYAHSSYTHFAWVKGPPGVPEPRAEPYDPDRLDELLHDAPDYGPGDGETGFDLTSDRFTVNAALWKQGKEAAAEKWSGEIISGRYGQPGDSHGDLIHKWFIEGPADLPAKYLTPARGSLPHHIEIAVDSAEPDSHHRLYSGAAYEFQFRIRVNTAAAHIRQAYLDATRG